MHNLRKKITIFLLLAMLINVFSIFRIEASSDSLINNQELSETVSGNILKDFIADCKKEMFGGIKLFPDLDIPDLPDPDAEGEGKENTDGKKQDTSGVPEVPDLSVEEEKELEETLKEEEEKSHKIFVSVTRIWKNADGNTLSNVDTKDFSEFEMRLQRRVGGKEDSEFNEKSQPVVIKYSDDKYRSWNHVYENLEDLDKNGKPYEYYIYGDDGFKVEKKYSEIELEPLVDAELFKNASVFRRAGAQVSNPVPGVKYVDGNSIYEKTKYYKQSPLGIVGGFHLVGFNSVHTKAHTNGNILTHTLKYQEHFGTRGPEGTLSEVSYFKKLEYFAGGAFNSVGGNATESRIVVGKGVNVGVLKNAGDGKTIEAWTLDGHKVDSPRYKKEYEQGNELWQDTETEFINILKIKSDSEIINKQLSYYKDAYSKPDYKEQNSQKIIVENPDDVSVYNWEHGKFNTQGYSVDIHGFVKGKNGSLIINVDMNGRGNSFTMPGSVYYYGGQAGSIGETIVWEDGNTIWNFYDSSKPDRIYRGKINNSRAAMGIILAPGATVDLTSNFDGTVVANDIIVSAESHRTDFTGKSIDYPADFQFKKIGKDNKPLKDAVFELTDKDGKNGDKGRPYKLFDKDGNDTREYDVKSGDDGKVNFYHLKTGTYYLYEKEAPDGYKKIEGAIAKIVIDTKTKKKEITVLQSGFYNKTNGTVFNEEEPKTPKTKVGITKKWTDYEGREIDRSKLKNLSVNVRLKRKVGNVVDDDFKKYSRIELNQRNNWSVEISNLEIKDKRGNTYTYFVEEYNVPDGFNWDIKSSIREWEAKEIGSGGVFTFTLINKANKPVYPSTGGIGSLAILSFGVIVTLLGLRLRSRKIY